MTIRSIQGAILAGAVAGLFTAGSAFAADPAPKGDDTIHCSGINACNGKGSCAGADNSCKGKNTCKGKGWVDTSKKDCKAKGGKVVASK
jgi:hypothetical protein